MQNKTSSKGTTSAKAAQSKSTAKTSNCSGKAQSKSAQAKSTSKASAKKA